MNKKFNNAVNRINQQCPPIWLMRQAGRYQPSYMKIKETYNFEQMCKTPEVAADVAMLPINEFDFDIAILFSDILWHLEGLGLPMYFNPGPKFDEHLSMENWNRFADYEKSIEHLKFQEDAIKATLSKLPNNKSLIGFVGGPISLLNYAIGCNAVTFNFKEMYLNAVIIPLLKESIKKQLAAGAEAVMILDSGLINISSDFFEQTYIPLLGELADIPNVGYYARGLTDEDFAKVTALPWSGIGLDSNINLQDTLTNYNTGFVQGNFDERNFLLDKSEFTYKLKEWLDTMNDVDRTGWICGAGHGIIKETPTENVRLFVDTVRQHYGE